MAGCLTSTCDKLMDLKINLEKSGKISCPHVVLASKICLHLWPNENLATHRQFRLFFALPHVYPRIFAIFILELIAMSFQPDSLLLHLLIF